MSTILIVIIGLCSAYHHNYIIVIIYHYHFLWLLLSLGKWIIIVIVFLNICRSYSVLYHRLLLLCVFIAKQWLLLCFHIVICNIFVNNSTIIIHRLFLLNINILFIRIILYYILAIGQLSIKPILMFNFAWVVELNNLICCFIDISQSILIKKFIVKVKLIIVKSVYEGIFYLFPWFYYFYT